MRPKKVQIFPGIAFKAEDVSELPDLLKQKHYRSFVAKLQFAATCIRFDISFAVSQLAHFCALAGTAQWSALHHPMEYLAGRPSFKIKYRRGMKLGDMLSGYADAYWGNSSSRRSTSGRRRRRRRSLRRSSADVNGPRHPEALRLPSHSKWCKSTGQGSDCYAGG